MRKMRGKVIRGKQRGRTLGFPTANVKIGEKPGSGVYTGEVILDSQRYPSAVFVPEAGDFIEAHILNFSKNIYGKTIEIVIGKKIREVRKFQGDEELKEQIILDIECLGGRN